MAVLIVHPEHGVYLGYQGGAFWSNVFSAQVGVALTFPDEAAAEKHMREKWVFGRIHAIRFVNVTPDFCIEGVEYASLEACIYAGAPPWLNAGTHVVGPPQ